MGYNPRLEKKGLDPRSGSAIRIKITQKYEEENFRDTFADMRKIAARRTAQWMQEQRSK